MEIFLGHFDRKITLVIEIKKYVFMIKRTFMRKFMRNNRKNRDWPWFILHV